MIFLKYKYLYSNNNLLWIQKDEIKNEFYKLNLKGVDRIVPIGQALSIELDWDGYELFSSMIGLQVLDDYRKNFKNFDKKNS